MAPFIALVLSFFIFQVIGLSTGIPYLDTWQESLRGAVAVMFLLLPLLIGAKSVLI